MPWETIRRLPEIYGIEMRDAETLVSFDEVTFAGVDYFEDVVKGDHGLGKKAVNWSVLL
jgi:Asp-tRNA(Asn)/Glu-tRNA(Gln) amidotransferase B subunit